MMRMKAFGNCVAPGTWIGSNSPVRALDRGEADSNSPAEAEQKMRGILKVGLVGAPCVGLAVVAMMGLSAWRSTVTVSRLHDRVPPGVTPARQDDRAASDPSFPLFSEGGFENAGFPTACRFTGPIRDNGSIEETREAIRTRARRGIAELRGRLQGLSTRTPEDAFRVVQTLSAIAYLSMSEGDFDEAAAWAERALATATAGGGPRELRANLEALVGVIHLRRGETENCLECLGPSSCIFPIAVEAIHRNPSGSREAVRRFTAYLKERPEDQGVVWLLNLSQMTLGGYPSDVSPGYRIALEPFRSRLDVGRFANVASEAGLTVRGANMAGGSILDDFTDDGLPDVFTTSYDVDLGASLFVNRGDGTFEDRSGPAGLSSQPLAVNCAQGDFDNDGRLDVLLLRGGWEGPSRLSLLRNRGEGRFEDVTLPAGMGEPIASHAAAWGDFDNDGRLDVFVCGEYATSTDDRPDGYATEVTTDPRNRCRLYRNNGDGTFTDVAERAGVRNERYAKGAACGDYDGDGDLDLYVANVGGGNRLYRNEGDGTFIDVAPALGVTEPRVSFPCWFWDFDNDGRLDIFVTDYEGSPNDVAASALGRGRSKSHPRLYRNLGAEGFRDVSLEVGLDRVALAMGANFGDVDNDGYLDIYLGTGLPGFSALMPNLMYKNVEGRRFEDVTMASGTGHLQKGHGVSFADVDGDGDLDLFAELGGAVPGDKAFNVLFRNPGHGRHWLKLKLVGERTNRAALGARVRVDFQRPDGSSRSVHRQIGGDSSYGGNTLVESIGLGEATRATVTVAWPASGVTRTYRDLDADRALEITEGSDAPRVLDGPRPSRSGAR
jgi:hypothetical protein